MTDGSPGGGMHPSLMTPQRRSDLLKWVTGGLPVETAARLLGLKVATVTDWRTRSLNGERGYENFETDLQRALAEGEAVHVARIAEAGRINWHASAWLLERMYPEKWGVALSAPDGPTHSTPAPETNEFPGL